MHSGLVGRSSHRRVELTAIIVALLGAGVGVVATRASAHRVNAHSAAAQQCSDPHPATRVPGNPLDLPHAPGRDPLNGARFFVPGPAHGAAAQTIARLAGASVSADETWAQFRHQLQQGSLAAKLRPHRGLAHEVAELSKIAGQPEAQRFSSYAGGGDPGATFAQVQKIFCTNLASDPRSIPIITTYFMHADLGSCPTPAQVRADQPVFHRRVDEMAAATARRPAVFLLEIDALGTSSCVTRMGSMP